MGEEDAMRLLKALLEREGAEWSEEAGYLRFRLRRGAMLWETACRAGKNIMLFYGRFPFRCGDIEQAWKACGEMNRRLTRGALFLAEDGYPVYRCEAELDDVFGAEERILSAMRYSAQVMGHCWGRLSGI